MIHRSHQADNITMSGGGLYSLATKGAKDVIDLATPQVLSAVRESPLGAASYWCFSDLGCADGGTSLDLWRSVITAVRQRSDADIQIVYADQARNDFNALIHILHGLTEFDSYLAEARDVRVLESGASFYTPILPRNSLHLGFSATAMHWLSRKPCDLSNHVHMVGAVGSERALFAAQASEDWQRILLHRARELVPGGHLILVNFCCDEQGRYLGNTTGVNMFDNFNRLWQSRVEQGVITRSEYQAMTLPQYYNTVQEFQQPFKDPSSAVSRSGLRLKAIHTAVVPCPFAREYQHHRDASRFAAEYIPTIRSWNESIFYAGLSAERSEAERRQLIEQYYSDYQQQVAESPTEHRMDYVHAYMTIVRE